MPGFEIANYLFNLKLRLRDVYVDINYFIYIIVDNVLKLETNHKEIIDEYALKPLTANIITAILDKYIIFKNNNEVFTYENK